MLNALILIPEITKGMKSIGSKSLLKIKNNKYIIEHQIEQLLNINKNIRLTIATGFDSDKIIKLITKYNTINYIYNSEYEYTNFGKSLKLYLQNYPEIDNLLLISSGILFKSGTFKNIEFEQQSQIFLLDKPKYNFDIGCSQNNIIEYLFYDLPEVWSECIYLDKIAIKNLIEIIENKNIDHMYIFEIINILLSKDIKFKKIKLPKNNFVKINSAKDVGKAKVFV